MVSREERLAKQKRADYMRTIGMPLNVSDEEMEEVAQLCDALHELGMSWKQIGRSTHPPVSDTVIMRVVQGKATKMHRDVYRRLKRVQYVEPIEKWTGRPVDPTGMRRRLQALVARGFSYNVLGELLGTTPNAVQQLALRDTRTFASTLNTVATVYAKLQYADPMDYGGTVRTVHIAQGVAARRGFALPMCWDEDTIDDPEAFPEWTGACGTNEGYWLHKKYDMPMCEVCEVAGKPSDPPLDPRFDRKLFQEMRVERGWNAAALAKKAGLDPGTVASWEKGRTRPKGTTKLAAVCKVLGVDPDLFFPSEET